MKTRTRNSIWQSMKQADITVPTEPNEQYLHYRRQQRATSDSRVKLYLKEYGPQNETLSRRLVHEEECNTESGMVKIDVTPFLIEENDDPEGDRDNDHLVVLEADFEPVNEVRVSTKTQEARMTVISEIGEEGGRSKRNVNSINSDYCRENPHERRCCLRQLVVDFRQIGWKWVIYPPTISINYCSGTCPYTWPSTAERYPTVLNAYRVLNPTSAPEPCCTASKIRGVPAIVKRAPDLPPQPVKLSNMIIESCICG